jgi:hypothetical protein
MTGSLGLNVIAEQGVAGPVVIIFAYESALEENDECSGMAEKATAQSDACVASRNGLVP